MGIDIYARWPKQTKEEKEAQYTGFDATAGRVGYLREAYHGGPYATRVLVPEAFADDNADGDYISAATLRERLPETLETAMARSRAIYGEEARPEILQSFVDFVELCERKERETGRPCYIVASY